MSKRWKLATKKEIDGRDELIKIKDHEGLWYEQQDMMKKYLRRPSDLEEICSSQFVKMYTTFGRKMIKNDKENEQDENEPNEKKKKRRQ